MVGKWWKIRNGNQGVVPPNYPRLGGRLKRTIHLALTTPNFWSLNMQFSLSEFRRPILARVCGALSGKRVIPTSRFLRASRKLSGKLSEFALPSILQRSLMREGIFAVPSPLSPFPFPAASGGIHKSFSFVAKSISAPRLSSLQREQGGNQPRNYFLSWPLSDGMHQATSINRTSLSSETNERIRHEIKSSPLKREHKVFEDYHSFFYTTTRKFDFSFYHWSLFNANHIDNHYIYSLVIFITINK